MAKKQETNERNHTHGLYVLNIKLQSGSRRNEAGYTDLIKDLHRRKIYMPVRGGKQMILRTQHSTEIDGHVVLYGKISKFNKIETDDWINVENMEKERVNIPKNRFPNLKEIDYYFIPQAHRFCIRRSLDVSIKAVEDFLNKAIAKAKYKDEHFSVSVEQSSDGFDEIYNAKEIRKLRILISYTNDDITKDATKWMDLQLKQMNAGSFEIDITSDNTDNISLKSKVLKGALGLAQSNGVVEATVIDTADKKKLIKTDDYPKSVKVEFKGDDNAPSAVYDKITKMFRKKNAK